MTDPTTGAQRPSARHAAARSPFTASVEQGGPQPRQIRRFGWSPDLPDHRDFLYAAPTPALRNLPTSVDLRPQCPPVYDQGELGSCTANALAGAIEYDQMREPAKYATPFVPSRLFIYYNERKIEGTVAQDSGAQIRDGIKSVASVGVCSEATDWPYDITKFTDAPPKSAYADAARYKVTSYLRLIQDLNTMKGCLASGFPFVFGFTAYSSLQTPEVDATGQIPMPSTQDSMIGGHAVVAVGYDDGPRTFTIRNSWGDKWGAGGYGFMPYSYLLERSLAQDFWTVRSA